MKVETNLTIEHLRELILTNEELVTYERQNDEPIRLLSVRRYEARFEVESRVFNFRLSHPSPHGHRCLLNETGNGFLKSLVQHKLLWHKAAEALLAIRKGHMEYRRNRQLKADPIDARMSA